MRVWGTGLKLKEGGGDASDGLFGGLNSFASGVVAPALLSDTVKKHDAGWSPSC